MNLRNSPFIITLSTVKVACYSKMVDNPKLKHQRSNDADTSHSTKKEPVETVDDDDGNDGKLEIGG